MDESEHQLTGRGRGRFWSIALLNVVGSLAAFGTVFLMNQKGIGKGSQPSWGVPYGIMSMCLFQVVFLVFADLPKKKLSLAFLVAFTIVALSTFVYIWNL